MPLDEVTPKMFGAVAQYIGKDLLTLGRIDRMDMSDISIPDLTWEEFVVKVYDHMICYFIIDKEDINQFNAGVAWIKKQKWKDS